MNDQFVCSHCIIFDIFSIGTKNIDDNGKMNFENFLVEIYVSNRQLKYSNEYSCRTNKHTEKENTIKKLEKSISSTTTARHTMDKFFKIEKHPPNDKP